MMDEKEIISVSSAKNIQSTDEIIALAETRLKNVEKLITLSLSRTNENDWVDQNGRPYLTGSGAEKIARLFGIKLHSIESKKIESRDEKGPFYFYQYTGVAELPGGIDSIEAVGTCSSKDVFFAKKGGEWKPMSEVDETNIMKSAYTNFEVNAITRLLGIRNLTWDRVKAAGIKVDKVAKVQYQSGAQTGSYVISEAQNKRLWAICKDAGVDKERLKRQLKNLYNIESATKIKREWYDDICSWAQSQKAK